MHRPAHVPPALTVLAWHVAACWLSRGRHGRRGRRARGVIRPRGRAESAARHCCRRTARPAGRCRWSATGTWAAREEAGRRNTRSSCSTAGHHILPWFGWPQGDPDGDAKAAQRFDDYYAALLTAAAQLQLPICFRGTQWEAMLVGKEYRQLPPDQCPAVITPEGKAIAKLCPFGPVDPWRDPAASTSTRRR